MSVSSSLCVLDANFTVGPAWRVRFRSSGRERVGVNRIGRFDIDLQSGELRLVGSARRRLVLREQPFQVLRMLVERQGKIVTRDEIQRKLWPNQTIVDFDHSINVAIAVLRRALRDSADN